MKPRLQLREVLRYLRVQVVPVYKVDRRRHDLVVVEGAGGLLVPLSDSVDMVDFACRLDAELVVATRPTLGTLNHTALTVEAARRRALDPDRDSPHDLHLAGNPPPRPTLRPSGHFCRASRVAA